LKGVNRDDLRENKKKEFIYDRRRDSKEGSGIVGKREKKKGGHCLKLGLTREEGHLYRLRASADSRRYM